MKFALALALTATAVQGVRVSHLQKRTRAATAERAAHIDEIPSSYREAGYPDEDFFTTKSNDISFLEGRPEHVSEGVVGFSRYEFPQVPDHWPEAGYEADRQSTLTIDQIPSDYHEAGYDNEDFFAEKSDDVSFLEAKESGPVLGHTVVKLYKYEFPQRDNWYEAQYSAEQYRPRHVHDIPESFLEAGYPDEDFFEPKQDSMDTAFVQYEPEEPQVSEESSVYHIGIVPESYDESLYQDDVANLGFLQAYEIHHPTIHGHTDNVLGTKQEGRNFWTDTTQPDMRHYKSSRDDKDKEALTDTGGAISKEMSSSEDPEEDVQEENCADCTAELNAKREALYEGGDDAKF